MTRMEYCDKVVSTLRRLTLEEKQAVREEIDGHMEDRMEALLALGYDEALAEERTMAAMGDPEEVARELDKQYPLRWMVLGRTAVILSVILCAQMVLGLGILGNAIASIEARIYPDKNIRLEQVEITERVDCRAVVGNDVLRIYRVSMGKEEGTQLAEVAICTYDRFLCGIVSEELLNNTVVNNQRGEDRFSGSGSGSWTAEYALRYVEVQPGDTYVTVEYDRFGESFLLEVPLPGEVTP